MMTQVGIRQLVTSRPLALLAAVPRRILASVLIAGTLGATAIAMLAIAIFFGLNGTLSHRAVLFVLGEKLSRRKGEAPEPTASPSPPVPQPSVAGGGYGS